MCLASTDPGGPKRCSGDCRHRAETTTSWVQRLEAQQVALLHRVGAPEIGGADWDHWVARQMYALDDVRDSELSQSGISDLARQLGWAAAPGPAGSETMILDRFRGESPYPMRDRSDSVRVRWSGNTIIEGVLTVNSNGADSEVRQVFGPDDNRLLLAWLRRPGRPTSPS